MVCKIIKLANIFRLKYILKLLKSVVKNPNGNTKKY